MKDTGHLSEDQKKALQLKLRHYLRTYRQRNEMTAGQMAEKLGWTEIHQRRYESTSPENRLMSSLDLISVFASLTDMKLGDFVTYLSDETKAETEESSLTPWEMTLLDCFRSLDLTTRSEFVHGLCSKYGKSDQAKFRSLVELMVKFDSAFSNDEFTLVKMIVDYIATKRGSSASAPVDLELLSKVAKVIEGQAIPNGSS